MNGSDYYVENTGRVIRARSFRRRMFSRLRRWWWRVRPTRRKRIGEVSHATLDDETSHTRRSRLLRLRAMARKRRAAKLVKRPEGEGMVHKR